MNAGRYAGAVAGCYAVTAGSYIILSSRLAASHSASLEELQRIETIKGVLFVAASSALCFALTFAFMRRFARQQDLLAASERRATAGLFACSVAHDFNNVLTVAGGYADQIAEDPEISDGVRADIDAIRAAVLRGRSLAERLAHASGGNALTDREPVDLATVVSDCVALVRGHRSARGARIEVVGAPSLPAVASVAAVEQIVTNLVLNAAEASPNGHVRAGLHRDGDDAVLDVEDDGPGVPEPLRVRIFEGFVTTKKDGLGLGLYAVRTAVEAHGGSIEVARSDLGGARFVVRLRSVARDLPSTRSA